MSCLKIFKKSPKWSAIVELRSRSGSQMFFKIEIGIAIAISILVIGVMPWCSELLLTNIQKFWWYKSPGFFSNVKIRVDKYHESIPCAILRKVLLSILVHNLLKNVRKGPDFLWQTQIQMIEWYNKDKKDRNSIINLLIYTLWYEFSNDFDAHSDFD